MAEHTWPWIYYHPTEGSRIFESEEELKAAGRGWTLTPHEAADAAAQASEKAPAPDPEPSAAETPPRRSHR